MKNEMSSVSIGVLSKVAKAFSISTGKCHEFDVIGNDSGAFGVCFTYSGDAQ